MKSTIKIFFFIWIFIILISFTNAVNINNDLSAYFNMSNEKDSSSIGLTCTNNGVSFLSNGVIDEAGQFVSASNDYISCGDNSAIDITTEGTFSFWLNITTLSGRTRILDKGPNTAYSIDLETNVAGCPVGEYCLCVLAEGSERKCNVLSPVKVGSSYTHYVIFTNMTNIIFYLNGSLDYNVGWNVSRTFSQNNDALIIGAEISPSEYFNGRIDELGIYNKQKNTSFVETLYNSGAGCNPVVNPNGCSNVTSSPSLTLNSNFVNNTINYNSPQLNITYNGTLNNQNTDLFNCSLYDNSSLINSSVNVDLTELQYFYINTLDTTHTYLFNLSCQNYEINETSIGIYTYKVDSVNVQMETNLINLSSYAQLSSVVLFVNWSDLNLFAGNETLYNPDNSINFNYFFENLTSITYVEYNITKNLVDTGIYTFDLWGWDSHTDKKIKNYDITKLSNGLEFNKEIKIYGDDIINSYYVKKKDRYNFGFEYDKNKTKSKTIYIESDSPLFYLKDSKYKYHFVDFKNKKWIDFEGVKLDNVIFTKISNYKYEIKFNNENTLLEFNSIGDLNEIHKQYFFSVTLGTTSTTSINLTNLENKIESLRGGNIMIFLGIFILAFLIGGILSKQFWLWIFSGSGIVFIGITFIDLNRITESLYNTVMAIGFITLGIGFIFGAVALTIMTYAKNNKQEMDDGFYNTY